MVDIWDNMRCQISGHESYNQCTLYIFNTGPLSCENEPHRQIRRSASPNSLPFPNLDSRTLISSGNKESNKVSKRYEVIKKAIKFRNKKQELGVQTPRLRNPKLERYIQEGHHTIAAKRNITNETTHYRPVHYVLFLRVLSVGFSTLSKKTGPPCPSPQPKPKTWPLIHHQDPYHTLS